MKIIQVPTGHICTMKGEKLKDLEFLCIGDYGKDTNIKAEFLNITRELNGVPNSDIMPLSEKMVVTISTQYGCSMNCLFCDVPKVGVGLNVTYNDLNNQIIEALKLHPEVSYTNRLNIHFARMGEPTWNNNVLRCGRDLHNTIKPYIGDSLVHPVISTMMPKNNRGLVDFLLEWCNIKNDLYGGDVGLQLSINSTNDEQRNEMFSGNTLSLDEISDIMKYMPSPIGRKYTLNFALADEYEIEVEKLSRLFSPDKFMVKITPLHMTNSCTDNNIRTTNGYESYVPYKETEQRLINGGFDVIVFIPSYDEDRGLITCGNAILSGNMPKIPYTIITE